MTRKDINEDALRGRILATFPEQRLPVECFAEGASVGFDGQGLARINDQPRAHA